MEDGKGWYNAKMLYQDILFKDLKSRPFFYTNFVSSIDGKGMVKKNPRAYWPIGTKKDQEVLSTLRAKADILIHGKNTAHWYRTIDVLQKKEFLDLRQQFSKPLDLPYVVISKNPTAELGDYLDTFGKGSKPYLVTTKNAIVPTQVEKAVDIVRFGENEIDLEKMSEDFYRRGWKSGLIEGGPTLLGQFFAKNLIDEVFLTIAPKIIGNEDNATLTMVENFLFSSNDVTRCTLKEVNPIDNEVFLRYEVLHR